MSLIWSILCLPFLLALTSSKPLSRAHTPRQESTLPPCGDVIAWVKNGEYRFIVRDRFSNFLKITHILKPTLCIRACGAFPSIPMLLPDF